MKFPLFALSVIAASASFASTGDAQNYPWCARIDLGDEVENCGFESLEQCKASLSGGGDHCVENNTYKPLPPESTQSENVTTEGSATAQAVPIPKKKPQRH
jgi:Protein of unknown function (DUF3551)